MRLRTRRRCTMHIREGKGVRKKKPGVVGVGWGGVILGAPKRESAHAGGRVGGGESRSLHPLPLTSRVMQYVPRPSEIREPKSPRRSGCGAGAGTRSKTHQSVDLGDNMLDAAVPEAHPLTHCEGFSFCDRDQIDSVREADRSLSITKSFIYKYSSVRPAKNHSGLRST